MQSHRFTRLILLFALFLGPGIALGQEKQRVLLQARLSAEGPVIEDGVEWRIFRASSATTGKLEELVYSFGGSKAFDIEPGDYYVHAAYGHAGAVRKISVSNIALREEFTLNAGGLKLNATSSSDVRIPNRLLRFDVYEEEILENGNRKLLARNVKPEEIIAFPVGTYHVVSRFGDHNATVRADLRVRLGKLTTAVLQHRAAIITFRLVRQLGGDAVADTAWSILTENGEVIQESTSTFPTLVLAEGNYTAIARHNDAVYSEDFLVRSGFNTDVEVLVPN
ncbi:MAG: hypothetical protein QNJ29_04500 [Rhizobiaceae bacterium]|nr:hypothetical protein [Rhizobiaceae bacterium]